MKKPSSIVLAVAIIALPACSTLTDLPTERIAAANLTQANGVPAGTVQLLASGDRLSLAVAVSGLSAGVRGFHLHETGKCKAPDFSSAGGHLNPTDKDHGNMNPAGSHVGDLPNLEIGTDSITTTTIDLQENRADILSWLFDDDGTAVVIHSNADDYRSNPSGNSGPRIICGVLKRV